MNTITFPHSAWAGFDFGGLCLLIGAAVTGCLIWVISTGMAERAYARAKAKRKRAYYRGKRIR